MPRARATERVLGFALCEADLRPRFVVFFVVETGDRGCPAGVAALLVACAVAVAGGSQGLDSES